MTMDRPRTGQQGHVAHRTGTLSPWEQTHLWDMENQFWTADAEASRATTATNAVMIFPAPSGILQGDQIWLHLGQRPGWRSVKLTERRVTSCRDVCILTYRAAAEKADAQILKALCASTYMQDGEHWLRLFHQQCSTA